MGLAPLLATNHFLPCPIFRIAFHHRIVISDGMPLHMLSVFVLVCDFFFFIFFFLIIYVFRCGATKLSDGRIQFCVSSAFDRRRRLSFFVSARKA